MRLCEVCCVIALWSVCMKYHRVGIRHAELIPAYISLELCIDFMMMMMTEKYCICYILFEINSCVEKLAVMIQLLCDSNTGFVNKKL